MGERLLHFQLNRNNLLQFLSCLAAVLPHFFHFGIRSTVAELHDDIESSGRVNAR